MTLYLIVAECPNCGEKVRHAEETESPVPLMQDVPISASCCSHCGGLVHEWDVHEDHEIERVTPSDNEVNPD